MYLKELQDSGLGDSSESALTRSCVSPAHVKADRNPGHPAFVVNVLASQREADNLRTEVPALDYGGTAEFETVGKITGEIPDEK
jgi:hypothetical protein